MVQRTVLKVDISCPKCKKKILKAVTGLEGYILSIGATSSTLWNKKGEHEHEHGGVDQIEVDAAKGTLTVTGNADPYEIIVRCRKAGKFAEVVSVGPPPAPPKPKQDEKKKPEEKKAADQKAQQVDNMCHHPHVVMWEPSYYEPNPSCSIM